MLGYNSFASRQQTVSLPGCLFGSFPVRRFFFPFLLLSSLSFLAVFVSSFRKPIFTFDPPQFLPCGMQTPVSLMDIQYDEKAIVRQYVREHTPLNKKLWKRIKPAMSTSERQTLRRILSVFIEVADSHNFTYFLISGTLLGSYRHHGLMPWDDDVDILMPYAERDEILKQFRNYSTENEINVETGNLARMKVFHKYRSIAVKGWRYRWPTIDISFYAENDTHVWERDGKTKYHIIPKSLVFPLHLRPFEMLMMNSPYDAFAVLKLLYADPQCVTLSWIHKMEKHPGSILRFNCDIARPFYPFVHREVRGMCVEESLILNGKVLYRLPVEEPLYAISNPYILELVDATNDSSIAWSHAPLTKQSIKSRNDDSSKHT